MQHGGDDKGFTASESDDNEDGYDNYESFNKKGGDKYSYETFDDGKQKPKALYAKEEESGGDDKGYLKKDSKKGSKGYKNFKSFSNKDKDDYNIEKHSGFSALDSDSQNGDIVSKPIRNYHHYEVTENNGDDEPKSHSHYSAYPGGYESYTSHDDHSGEGDSGSSSSESASYSNGGEDGGDSEGDDDEGSSEHSSHYEEEDGGDDDDHSGGSSDEE